MGKILVMAVGPVTRRHLMPAIERSWRLMEDAAQARVDAEASIDRVARRVALAAEITFAAQIQMERMDTAAVARCLGTMVTAHSLAQVLTDPSVLIGDHDVWWPRGRRSQPVQAVQPSGADSVQPLRSVQAVSGSEHR